MDKDSKFKVGNLRRLSTLLSYGYSSEKLKKYCLNITESENLSVENFLIYLIDVKRMSDFLLINFRPYQKNLQERHFRLQSLYNISRNQLQNLSLQEISKNTQITQYGNKYIAICPDSVEAFKEEASNQRNCVLSYAPRVCEGECKIVFIRYAENLHESYITLELDNNNVIVQAKKYMNKSLNENDSEYLAALALMNNWIFRANEPF